MSLSHRPLITAALALLLATPGLTLASDPAAASSPQAPPPVEAPLDGKPLVGTVLETMNASGYTYLLLDTAQAKIWAAIPESPVKVGQEVRLSPGMTMSNFTSKTLNRTFEAIVFSPGLVNKEEPAAPVQGQAKGGNFDAALKAESKAATPAGETPALGPSSGSLGAIVPSAEVNVNKATGQNSFSVGECFEQGKELSGKTVRVRGKIMKISRMIMGKNWLHIQDGTGSPLKNQHDLVATTASEAAEGEIVTLEGVLGAERDFGAGYRYEVILEDVKIEK